jgi:hypothetical protein
MVGERVPVQLVPRPTLRRHAEAVHHAAVADKHTAAVAVNLMAAVVNLMAAAGPTSNLSPRGSNNRTDKVGVCDSALSKVEQSRYLTPRKPIHL